MRKKSRKIHFLLVESFNQKPLFQRKHLKYKIQEEELKKPATITGHEIVCLTMKGKIWKHIKNTSSYLDSKSVFFSIWQHDSQTFVVNPHNPRSKRLITSAGTQDGKFGRCWQRFTAFDLCWTHSLKIEHLFNCVLNKTTYQELCLSLIEAQSCILCRIRS